MKEEIIHLPVELIDVEEQVRSTVDSQSLNELRASEQALGQLQAILVRRNGDRYLVVFGHRRLSAAQMNGRATIKAVVVPEGLTAADILKRQLAENVQREELSPMDKARALARLMQASGQTASQVAAELGMSPTDVTRLVAMLNLPEAVQRRVEEGTIPASAAYQLSQIEDPEEQAALAAQVTSGQLTRDGLAGLRKARRQSKQAPRTTGASRFTAPLGAGCTVTVAAADLDIEKLIAVLEDLLRRVRRVRPQGVALNTFAKMLKDQHPPSGGQTTSPGSGSQR